jgi:hypothetical protein
MRGMGLVTVKPPFTLGAMTSATVTAGATAAEMTTTEEVTAAATGLVMVTVQVLSKAEGKDDE